MFVQLESEQHDRADRSGPAVRITVVSITAAAVALLWFVLAGPGPFNRAPAASVAQTRKTAAALVPPAPARATTSFDGPLAVEEGSTTRVAHPRFRHIVGYERYRTYEVPVALVEGLATWYIDRLHADGWTVHRLDVQPEGNREYGIDLDATRGKEHAYVYFPLGRPNSGFVVSERVCLDGVGARGVGC